MDSERASSNREMQAQTPPAGPSLCRTGCGFYAHSAFDGMCSKCYKDQMSASVTPTIPPSSTTDTKSIVSLPVTSTDMGATASEMTVLSTSKSAADTSPCIDESLTSTTESNLSQQASIDDTSCGVTPDCLVGAVADMSLDDRLTATAEKPKKKRCDRCRKRVGLTGFDCRCGGHFCSLHRYSDMHECSFDYHQMAQTEIRKQNPVVAAEKVAKI